jgi:hypothetical protein
MPGEKAFAKYSCFTKGMRTTNKNFWIGDLGASCHMMCSLDGMTNIWDIHLPVQVGSGESLKCMKIGDKHLCAIQSDRTMSNVVLQDCKYVPDLFPICSVLPRLFKVDVPSQTRV